MVVAVKQVEFEDRLKEFRAERIGMIREGEVPARMEEGARCVLHIVPQSGFESSANLDLDAIIQGRDFIWPINGGGSGSIRYNFDGLLSVVMNDGHAYSYVQLFHNGTVEAVNSSLLRKLSDRATITSRTFEEGIRKIVSNSSGLLKRHGIEAPLYIMLSLLGVKGYVMAPGRSGGDPYPIDRDDLIVPSVILESFEDEIDHVLLPAFNRVWNASGIARSPNYGEDNSWREKEV